MTTMQKLKIASFILYCLRWNYDMLWCFRAGDSLSCGKCLQTFFNKAIFAWYTWIASSNYIPDPCIPGFFSDIELCFDMFLRLFESLLGTVCSNFNIMFKLKKKASNDYPRAHLRIP